MQASVAVRDAVADDRAAIWPSSTPSSRPDAPAVRLWRSLGFEVRATVPEAFLDPAHGYVGLHVMHRRL